MDNMSDEEKKQAVGRCSFALLTLFSTGAFICGMYANAYCDFVSREVEFTEGFDLDAACAALDLTGTEEQICNTLFSNHGLGFYGWYGTVPVNEQVCLSYTLWNPNVGYVTPEFDTKFNSARAFAITANVFGAFAWFTLMMTSCCPLSQERLKGLSCYFTLATLFQGLSLLMFKSDVCKPLFFQNYFPNQDLDGIIANVSCSLGLGSKMAISATVLYFMSNNFIPTAIVPPPLGYGRAAAEETEAAAGDAEQGSVEAEA